mgnify:CR=1 FL=1
MSHGIHISPRTEPSIDGINALRGIPTTVISDVLGRKIGRAHV